MIGNGGCVTPAASEPRLPNWLPDQSGGWSEEGFSGIAHDQEGIADIANTELELAQSQLAMISSLRLIASSGQVHDLWRKTLIAYS